MGAIPVDDGDFYLSDEDEEITTTYDPCEDPSNPRKCASLWVGNITEKMSDADVEKLFSKYGKVKSAKACLSSFCAFVNYVEWTSASKAMRELQGCDIAGNKSVRLRWPDKQMGKSGESPATRS